MVKSVIENKTCFNSTYYKYNGIINNTCYFYGCKDECEKREIYRCFDIFGDLDKGCIHNYYECIEDCLYDINVENTEEYYSHKWKCIINETIEKINETKCY